MTRRSPTTIRRAARRGFTLIEVLLVVVIVGLLISLLVVAMSGALTSSKRAMTEQFVRTIGMGVEQFKNDFGYYPPLIDGAKHTVETQGRAGGAFDADAFRDELEDVRYHSMFSLPVYLLGVGEMAPPDFLDPGDPNYENRHDGVEGPGFRDPGPDRSWGGGAEREEHAPSYVGRVYGPYIDVGAGDAVRRVALRDIPIWDGNPMNIPTTPDGHPLFPDGGEAMDGADGQGDLFVFVDRWDQPIRYYRYWPTRDPENPRQLSFERLPTELLNSEALGALLVAADKGTGTLEEDPVALDRDILMRPDAYALLSAGANAEFGDTVTDAAGREVYVATDPNSGDVFTELMKSQRPQVVDRVLDNIRVLP